MATYRIDCLYAELACLSFYEIGNPAGTEEVVPQFVLLTPTKPGIM
jgi:hypothetical protein